MVISEDSGAGSENLLRWHSRNISGVIQRLGGAKDEDGVVRTLNEVPSQLGKKITTLDEQWGI